MGKRKGISIIFAYFFILFITCCVPQNGKQPVNPTIYTPPLTPTTSPKLSTANSSALSIKELDLLTGYPIFLSSFIGPGVTLQDINNYENLWGFNYYYFVDWIGNGCNVILQNDSGDLLIAKIDGKIKEELLLHQHLTPNDKEIIISAIRPSPNHEWVYYFEGRRDSEDQLGEYQNLVDPNISILSLSDPKNPKQLSEFSGSWSASWSHDSYFLAFSDFDENHIQQLYIFDIHNGTKRKASYFQDQNHKIIDINWSPDQNNIALTLYLKGNYRIEVINLLKSEATISIEDRAALWWINNEVILTETLINNRRNLEFIDIQSKKTIRAIDNNTFLDIKQIHPFQENTKIGFFNDTSFYIYDYFQNQFYRIKNISFEFADDWHVSPKDFPGLEKCE